VVPYIIRRLIFLFFVIFGVSVLLFGIMMTFSPERRAAAYVNAPQQFQDIPKIIKQYGLDDPVYLQYGRWLKQIFSGHFGWSIVAGESVLDAFLHYLPITVELNLYTMPPIILIGIWLGVLAGIHHDKPFDHITRIMAIIGWSLPTFLFALIVLMIFYGYFPLFPPGILSDQYNILIQGNSTAFTRYTSLYTIDGLLNGRLDIAWDAFRHLVMPVFAQFVVVVALLIRVMRSGMIEETSKEYIITARAKGADSRTVYFKHAKRNALIPVVTIAGWLVAFSMEGSISTEIVFNRKGIGWWLATSATQLDMPVLMAMCLFAGFVYVMANLIIDILYAYIDPRIRLN
jgi:peptide/nickel transport system permease protein